ncbi:NADH-quinone oxidoreductase subunit L [Adhaeribacter aquaticus]|uniref:NADH-quinone oxidoreductase subunit L n=1 Tax=Adhaeribacter aquaticus TaxID=299567 RepID=UPI000479EF28|nr:NADH-quinone oxidoreductase subunit L [Adhaeribacter aquaticus]
MNSLVLWALVVGVLPLFTFFILFLGGKKLPRRGDWLAITFTGISFLISLFLFLHIWQKEVVHVRFPWFELGGAGNQLVAFTSGIYLDNLSVLMLVIVTFISLLVQVFSVIYMHGDWRYHHYFAYLGLFTFSMLGIVLSDNLLLLFIFWELVGFSSYLLIGFWLEKDSATNASKKAFLFNRVGDIGFLFGIFVLYTFFGTFDLQILKDLVSGAIAQNNGFIFPNADGQTLSYTLLTLAGLGIFCGCVGKSAQFPLQVWLPDAMEGPTPVSSLIHAATMVAAGVYLLSRCFPFFTEDALLVIAIIGAVTALLGAIAACGQNDIKKILAFSTISQLGYMVMGMGVGAHDASLLHLVTHAFFKASLFLNAGIVIHAVHHAVAHYEADEFVDAQDIRNMGGLRKVLPLTFYAYIPATAALIGLPLFSGFLSKDAILSGAWAWAGYKSMGGNSLYYLIPVGGFSAVLLTAYYMARHCFYIFFGKNRLEIKPADYRHTPTKEASWLLLVPVLLLALFSIAFFFSPNPFDAGSSWFFQGLSLKQLLGSTTGLTGNMVNHITEYLHASSFIHVLTGIISVGLALVGIFIAWRNYQKASLKTNEELFAGQTGVLKVAHQHFYLNNFFENIFIRPFLSFSQEVAIFDKDIIDRSVNAFGKMMVILAKVIGWIDRKLVDGLVNFIAWLAGLIGKSGRLMQNGKIQSYYIFSLFGLILLILYILAF